MKTVLVLLLLLGGCTNAPAYIRVIEYGGGGVVTPVTGEVGGCSVYESDSKVSVQMTYAGKSCIVEMVK